MSLRLRGRLLTGQNKIIVVKSLWPSKNESLVADIGFGKIVEGTPKGEIR